MPSHKGIHICKPHEPIHNPKLAKEYAFLNAPADQQLDRRKKQRRHNSTYPKGEICVPMTVLWLKKVLFSA
jgi:hypothetical protein